MSPANVAIIVQARTGSTRFPEKVLRPFGGTTLLQHVVRRLRIGPVPCEIWVATTTLPEDDAIVAHCREEQIRCVRGPVDDVLQRFILCLDQIRPRPDVVVRICADRPFICTRLLAEMLDRYTQIGEPDYLCNNRPRSFPNGLDLEIVKPWALHEAAARSRDPIDHEHVTPYVYNHPERFSVANYPCPFGNFAWARMVVDTPLDYQTLLPVQAALEQSRWDYDYLDVLNYLTVDGSHLEANRHVPQFGVT